MLQLTIITSNRDIQQEVELLTMGCKQDHLDVVCKQDYLGIDKQDQPDVADQLDKVENQDQLVVVDKRDQEHEEEVVVLFDDMQHW